MFNYQTLYLLVPVILLAMLLIHIGRRNQRPTNRKHERLSFEQRLSQEAERENFRKSNLKDDQH